MREHGLPNSGRPAATGNEVGELRHSVARVLLAMLAITTVLCCSFSPPAKAARPRAYPAARPGVDTKTGTGASRQACATTRLVTTDAPQLYASARMDGRDMLVADVTFLLDSPDDYVRYWIAEALGNMGPAARSAIPKLVKMLPHADCMSGVITSAGGIRDALIKLRANIKKLKTGPPLKCSPIGG